jgi:hypothetical protein
LEIRSGLFTIRGGKIIFRKIFLRYEFTNIYLVSALIIINKNPGFGSCFQDSVCGVLGVFWESAIFEARRGVPWCDVFVVLRPGMF